MDRSSCGRSEAMARASAAAQRRKTGCAHRPETVDAVPVWLGMLQSPAPVRTSSAARPMMSEAGRAGADLILSSGPPLLVGSCMAILAGQLLPTRNTSHKP